MRPTYANATTAPFLVLVCLGAFALPSTALAFGPSSSFGSIGEGAGQMHGASGAAITDDGTFYIADAYNDRIDVGEGGS